MNMNPRATIQEQPEALREKKIVLVVDADFVSRFYTSMMLQRLNYHVFSVRSAEEALAIIELTVPLVVVTEITLPQMSGIDLMKTVKQNPRTRNVPVIMFTAVNADAQRNLCQTAGCSGFVVHSSNHNLLYAAIQQATERAPRQFVRLKTSFGVVVIPPGSNEQLAKVTAISEHGMFVLTQKPLPVGSAAEFKLQLPVTNGTEVRLQGRVLYSDASSGAGKAPGMGVKFLQVRSDDSLKIRDFIEQILFDGIVVSQHHPGS